MNMRRDDCRTILELLPQYHVGALRGRRLRAVEEHLSTCTECQRELEALSATAELLDATEPLRPSRDLWPAVAAALRSRETRPAWFRSLVPVTPRAAVAASLLVVVIVAAVVLLPVRQSHEPAAILPRGVDDEALLFAQWHAEATLTSALANPYAAALTAFEASRLATEPR